MPKKTYTFELIMPDNTINVYGEIPTLGILKALIDGEIKRYYNLDANITTHVVYNLIGRDKKVNIFLKQKVNVIVN
jgi:hypothetical protein